MNVKLKMSDRQILGLIVLICAGALGFAFLSESIWVLEPCHLCIYERIPYGLVLFLIPLVIMPRLGKLMTPLFVLLSLVFLTSTGLSVYHVGVENQWWSKPEVCAGPEVEDDSLETLRKKVRATKVVDCSEVQWELFGLSMAVYNALLSVFLLLLSLFPLARNYCCVKKT